MEPMIWAHRGASAQAPENTSAAFTLARDLGADGVELDVRRTRDGALAIAHDDTLPDVGVIADHELTDLRLAHPDLLTLGPALDVCLGLVVNVEIKNSPDERGYDPEYRAAAQVVALLHERVGRDHVVVSSFDLATLDRVRALDPAISTAYLTFGSDPLADLEVAVEHGHRGINPWFGALAGEQAETVCTSARARGVTVTPWTVDDPDTIRRLAAAGVHAIITNVPDIARAALGGV